MAAPDRYGIFWLIGTIVSFLLYYSGIAACYVFFRRRVLKRPRSIVLTYHRINADGEDGHISVSPRNFRRQMEYLKKDFKVVCLKESIDGAEQEGIRQDRASITFDDGYKDNYLNAYPVLKEFDLPAAVFVVTGCIGGDKKLNADEIRNMREGGIDFGSHTVTHPVLTEISVEEAAAEILDSKRELENLLDEKADYFAYPFGKKNHFNGQIIGIIKDAGYKAAFTTENGAINAAGEPFSLKRVGIRDCPLFVFKVRVSGIFESRLFSFARGLLRIT